MCLLIPGLTTLLGPLVGNQGQHHVRCSALRVIQSAMLCSGLALKLFRVNMQVSMAYHIRVLVPCYKESYDIVTRTLEVCSPSTQLPCCSHVSIV